MKLTKFYVVWPLELVFHFLWNDDIKQTILLTSFDQQW